MCCSHVLCYNLQHSSALITCFVLQHASQQCLLNAPPTSPRLFALAGDGKATELKQLLSSPDEGIESVRVMDSGGRTPLNLAILSGDLETVKVGRLTRGGGSDI